MDSNLTPNPHPQVALVARPGSQSAHYLPSPYSFETPEDPNAEIGLFEYWAVIRRNKGAIFISAIAGLIIGFSIGIPMKSVYRANTTIEVLAMNENFMNMRETNPVNNSTDSDVSEEATQAQLLASATLIKRVAARLNPTAMPAKPVPQAATPAWKSLLHFGPPAPTNTRAALIGKVAGSLKVKTNPRTRIIEATVESTDPQLAADFLNKLSDQFIQQNQESRLVTTEHTGDWLSHELADARANLGKSEDALQQYARNSGIVYTNESTNVATERLQQYQQSLSAATADRIAKQSRYELAQSSPPDALADVLNDGALRETQSKLNDTKRQIADLTTIYSPEYSKVRRLQAEYQSLQADFAVQRAEILGRIRTDYQEALRKERLLANAYSTQTHEVTSQGEKSIQYNILKREVDSNRQLYDTMLQQMKQASIATAIRASNVRVVDPAEAPSIPVFPDFKLNSALGAVAGLILSAFIVLVRDQTDRTLQVPGDIKRWAELPELGAIPNAAIRAGRKPYSSLATFKPDSNPFSSPLSLGQDANTAGSLSLQSIGGNLMAESFRFALTSIMFVGERGTHPRILLFTSPNPADGKTTVVSNIARAAAEIRLKVLIIDADLRRPRIHYLFDVPNEFGLSELLHGGIDGEALTRSVQSTQVPNLNVLTAGTPTQAAAHLLHSPNMAFLLKQAAIEYDMILIDTPPMMQMSDARIIARHSDAVILVARAGTTSRDALVAAKQRFEEDRIPVLGSVLNSWDPKRSTTRYYNRYADYVSG